MLKVWKHCRH